jgi:alpha-amylase
MANVKFILGVHNHQPVGNFDFVVEEAYQQAYRPFLALVAGHPWFKFALHNSGCLWEWLQAHHPEYLDQVRSLARRGQVELVGGGFYEPVLPAIPERDRQGQLEMMSTFLESEFGARPAGAWVAERVWEPALASTLADAGIRHAALDDAHFKSAGKFEHELDGHFLTDDQGKTLAVFPISQKLRYLVPFHPVDEVIGHLQSLRRDDRDVVAVLADDGEKFGVWPGTHDLSYTKGWLKDFLAALERNRDWLTTATYAECLASGGPRGRIYLPTGSYAEMGEWVLEPPAEAVYQELAGRLKAEGSYQRYSPFVRGGIWRNFLTKYPEANNIYRKMLQVSAKAAAAGPEALRELYRGQCNCAYWHGIFGGLYLPHLREALYRHLIRAESLIAAAPPGVAVETLDFDGDGRDEVLLSSPAMNLYLAPAQGGTIFEWDLRGKEYNLLDTLARRPESYHAKVVARHRDHGTDGKSIHEMTAAKEEGLEKLLAYDDCRRIALISRILGPSAALADLAAGRPCGTLLDGPWTSAVRRDRGSASVELELRQDGVRYRKRLVWDGGGAFDVELAFTNETDAAAELRPALEFNLGLLSSGPGRSCRSDDRRLEDGSLGAPREDRSLRHLAVADGHRRTAVGFAWDGPMDLWRYPVETVSQSEAGFERNYQCSCLLWHTRLALAAGESRTLMLRIGIEES